MWLNAADSQSYRRLEKGSFTHERASQMLLSSRADCSCRNFRAPKVAAMQMGAANCRGGFASDQPEVAGRPGVCLALSIAWAIEHAADMEIVVRTV